MKSYLVTSHILPVRKSKFVQIVPLSHPVRTARNGTVGEQGTTATSTKNQLRYHVTSLYVTCYQSCAMLANFLLTWLLSLVPLPSSSPSECLFLSDALWPSFNNTIHCPALFSPLSSFKNQDLSILISMLSPLSFPCPLSLDLTVEFLFVHFGVTIVLTIGKNTLATSLT